MTIDLPIEIINRILIMRPKHPLAEILTCFNRDLLNYSYILLPNIFVNMKEWYIPDVILKYIIYNDTLMFNLTF